MRLVIAKSALRASLAIYHLISNARLWNHNNESKGSFCTELTLKPLLHVPAGSTPIRTVVFTLDPPQIWAIIIFLRYGSELKIIRPARLLTLFMFLFYHGTKLIGGYHFEIDDGKVRWFHRNRNQIPVFNVITDDIVKGDVWTHLIGSYNSTTRDAKVS